MRLMRDLVDETLGGRYRLIARIAGGGMGDVYRGHDLLLDRAVAVKVLQHALSGDPELVERFKLEARAAARLTHPNVVAVYDWGSEDDSTYYMVMEYVSGTDLRDVLVARGVLEPTHAVQIVAAICDALAAAHATGLVHRDVKPENVLIARSGTVKVADFGIAAVVDADRTNPGGSIPGTLRYLSPEQAGGGDAGAASDLWAAGAILGELVTGRPPSQGAGPNLLRSRATEPLRPPSELSPRLPRVLDRIVLTACALDPAQRYGSAAEMSGALRSLEGDLPEVAPLATLVEDVTGDIRLPDMEPTAFTSRKHVRQHNRLRGLAIAFLAALLLLGGVSAAAAIFGPQDVEVPELVGLRLTQAKTRASDAGFKLEVVDGRVHVSVPAGEVIEQHPADGLLREGSAIAVVVSEGPPHTFVPSVIGMDLAEAKVRLASRQLELGEVARRYSKKPAGTVIDQSPGTGEARWGDTVKLVVSRGPRSIEIPNVTGMKVEKAKEILTEAGFEVVVVDAYSNDVPKGKVAYTTPGAGSLAPEGSEIEVVRSLGREFKKLKLPDVRNMLLSEARAKLEALGLRVWVNEVCDGGKIVADTDPLPGSTVYENDRIALFVVC